MAGRKVWAADDVLTAADVNGYLMDQAVMRFADPNARDGAILSPSIGMLIYVSSLSKFQTWNGSAWVGVTVDNATTVNTYKVFSTSGTATPPTASATGDLWFASA